MATPQKLFKDISDGKFKPAYYFYGQEDYRISEAVKYVAHQFLPDSQYQINFEKLNGKKIKCSDVITKLSNLPMLGEKQVFSVTDFQSFKPTEVKKIIDLLDPPDLSRIVIFSSPSDKTPKKSSAFFKSVSQIAEIVEFNKLSFDETARIIRSKLKKSGIEILPDALKLLMEMISGNRGALESETAKLIDYAEPNQPLTIDDIRTLCNTYEVYSLFELSDYIIAGQSAKVLRMIRQLVAEGISQVLLTTLIQQHFTSIYLVKNNKPPLGNRSFLTYKFKQQAARFSNLRLEDIIIEISRADALLRQTGSNPNTVFEMLAMNLSKNEGK